VVGKITATGARVVYLGTKPEPATASLHAAYRRYDQGVLGTPHALPQCELQHTKATSNCQHH
jgi:hypothetical protein